MSVCKMYVGDLCVTVDFGAQAVAVKRIRDRQDETVVSECIDDGVIIDRDSEGRVSTVEVLAGVRS